LGLAAPAAQTLTLRQANGGIAVNASVTNSQLINANLALGAAGTFNVTNNSAKNLTLARNCQRFGFWNGNPAHHRFRQHPRQW